jgi:CRISPR/Cas system Type II protein with McrA/HNH and RuvC-like nuclease domain
MSKYTVSGLWEQFYPNQTEVNDYTGRKMLKEAIGNVNSRYCPTIDHIRPLSKGGKDILGNIVLCNRKTNEEKADMFSTWKANGKVYQAKRVKGTSDEYDIYRVD